MLSHIEREKLARSVCGRRYSDLDRQQNVPNGHNDYSPGVLALHIAAERGNLMIVSLLLDNGVDANVRDAVGSTPLHCAVKHGHTSAAALLIRRGAQTNARDNKGWTPLHISVDAGFEDTTQMLISRGADCNAAVADAS